MICGGFLESYGKTLNLKEVDGKAFGKVMDMWSGKVDCQSAEMEFGEVEELASVADRFQMTEVISTLEEIVLKNLSMRVCGDVLNWSGELGLSQLEAAAWKLAKERFEEFAKTEGFVHMEEEILGRLLEDDELVARNEEAVWEALVWWIKANEGQPRGRQLVEKIRFPLMDEGYLLGRVVGMAPAEDAEFVGGVVVEALRAKVARGDGAAFRFELLGPKAHEYRVGMGMDWGDHKDGGQCWLTGHAGAVFAVAGCEGRVCSGSTDGSIRVWTTTNKVAKRLERTLAPEGSKDGVYSLSAWQGRLISGHGSGQLRVWNVETGTCDQVLEGHTRHTVWALAVCGSRLASGSSDKSVKIWGMGDDGRLACNKTLLGHAGWIWSLAGWQGKVLSGCHDKTIRVWDAGTGAHDATLAGHDGHVLALALHGDRLFSAASDGTIRVWAVGTWEALRTVEVHGRGTGQYPRCLAVVGSQLVSGSEAYGGLHGEVRVWDLESLRLERTLPQAAGADVRALTATDGGMWAGVGRDVAVWRRGP
jgi:hypothetical protein